MLKVVLDTNIVISATISSLGNPAKIMDLVFDEKIQAYYSPAILAEYKKVLARKRLNIALEVQSDIIEAIIQAGISIEPVTSNIPMSDESDRIFYDTALESGAILITGNIKHYPTEPFVMSPASFIKTFNTIP